jgi:hypothetical protein
MSQEELQTEVQDVKPIRVYPNPVGKFMMVETDLKGRGEVQLQHAVTGQTLLIQDIPELENVFKIDTEKFSAGLYILKINSARGVIGVTVMKE